MKVTIERISIWNRLTHSDILAKSTPDREKQKNIKFSNTNMCGCPRISQKIPMAGLEWKREKWKIRLTSDYTLKASYWFGSFKRMDNLICLSFYKREHLFAFQSAIFWVQMDASKHEKIWSGRVALVVKIVDFEIPGM